MKLPESNIETSTGGVLDSKTFSIGNPAIILNVLRTKIYTDPILAVCREIITNARDAHREVNTPDRPVEIEFPSAWEKNLRIKDYGPGISPGRMDDVFIKFGNSTKRTSNKQHGGYGIGAKSVLAYSDSFSVETIVNGLKYTYSAYIDETQVGKMDLMGEPVKTDERNGTTIIIPVKQEDRQRFIDLIVEVTKHWKVKPILKGDHSAVYPKYNFAFQGEKWAYPDDTSANRKSSGYSIYGVSYESYAIVDGIQYVIRDNSLPNTTTLHKAILQAGFHLYFDVGELTLSASRDNLYYDEPTQALLLKRLDELAEELVTIVSGSISSASNYIEACQNYKDAKKLFNRANLTSHLEGVNWRGNKIRETINIDDIGEWANIRQYVWDSYKNKVQSSRVAYGIDFTSPKVDLYDHDIKQKHVPGYLMDWLINQDRNRIIYVVATHDPPLGQDYQYAVDRAARLKKDPPKVEYDHDLLKLLNVKSLKAVIDKVPKEEKKRKTRRKVEKEDDQILGYNLNGTISSSKFNTKTTAFDADAGGIYVEVDYKEKNFWSVDKDGNKTLVPINKLVSAYNLLDDDIVGFSKARLKQLKKKGKGWRTFEEAITDKLNEYKKTYNIDAIKEAADNSQYFWHHYTSQYSLGELANEFGEDDFSALENQDSPLIKWYKESSKHLEYLRKCKEFRNFLRVFEKDNSLSSLDGKIRRNSYNKPAPIPSECRSLWMKVVDRYPLLKCLSNADRDDILHYINLIDRSKEKE